ncbi:MAG TPA: hypothetical protein VG276_00210 [Actinomycetes bacterium]|nr:hypothetical protein [Actinomycetes bacterium]
MLSKLASVKAVAVVLAAVLSVGGVAAAATGLLPTPAQWVAGQAPSTSAAGQAGQGVGDAAVAELGVAAKQGLCRAWQAGQGADNGRRADSPAFRALAAAAGGADNGRRKDSVAFRALAAAAGGADKVAAFCQATTPGGASAHGQGQGSSPTSVAPPSTTVSPPSSGPPPSTGLGGHGRGAPPTTTG